MIDLKVNLIRMPASITKERCNRRVPISWELRQILLELKEERLRTGARYLDSVFIREDGRPIKDITRAWKFALRRAEITDRRPHDFRRRLESRPGPMLACRTHAVKWWSGHVDRSVHGNYIIVTDEMVLKDFREKAAAAGPAKNGGRLRPKKMPVK